MDDLEGSCQGVGVILRRNGKLLMHLRDSNSWGIVSGAVEDGETPRQAGVREISEEAGISIDPGHLNYFIKILLKKRGNEVYNLFVADFPHDESELTVGEGKGFRYFTPAEVRELPNVITGVKEAIALYEKFY